MSKPDEETCPHLAPIQVTLDLVEGDLTLRHADCGLTVVADWSSLRAHKLPLTLVYVVDDADEDWLELKLPAGLDEWLADEQPQGDGDVRAVADAVVRLKAWLTGRQANVHSEISTTNVIAEPRDRSTAAWAIAESDVAAVVATLEARDTKGGATR